MYMHGLPSLAWIWPGVPTGSGVFLLAHQAGRNLKPTENTQNINAPQVHNSAYYKCCKKKIKFLWLS